MDAAKIIQEATNSSFAIWFLIGASLVFFMQAGFAMVETGFTRAKNAGNIIMKNLMDFCIGTIMYVFLGYGLMMSEDYVMGIIGVPNLGIFTNYDNFNWSQFVFQLVFCATAATIVSGAMAERTKFSAYCIYSGAISLIVYPIEAGWVWNIGGNGWLQQLHFVDFAGSAVIHSVGGMAALVGAIIVGPRIGKYTKRSNGKIRSNAIAGHSITLGALGCFILWFGWYGFNGAAATNTPSLASIFMNTTIAPATATVVCMIFTWIKDGKPDVGMCLNASLAGLVAITAGCDAVSNWSAIIIGAIAGVLVVFSVEFFDKVAKIDDPVGAISVHGVCGALGTILTGFFAIDGGLFYGGGFKFLGTQIFGVLCVIAWVAITITIIFLAIKHTVGLRVSTEEEIEGLDKKEHGLESSYADFMPMTYPVTNMALVEDSTSIEPDNIKTDTTDTIPVVYNTSKSNAKFTKVVILTKQDRFERLKSSLDKLGITGMTVTNVMGCGVQKGHIRKYRGVEIEEMNLNPKMKLEMVISAVPVETVIEAARKVLYTGNIGDGKIFVYDVEDVVKVRTGERGYDALQGE